MVCYLFSRPSKENQTRFEKRMVVGVVVFVVVVVVVVV
jgi:hypothetical protein